MIDPTYLERIGAFTDPADGQLKRHRIRNAHFEYDPDDPKAVLNGAVVAYDQQLVPHPVILPLATDEASIREAQQKAINAGADFYHPRHGWLRWGRKRETERPENLGAGTVRYQTRRVVLAGGQDLSPQPKPDPEPEPEPETEPDTEGPSERRGGSVVREPVPQLPLVTKGVKP